MYNFCGKWTVTGVRGPMQTDICRMSRDTFLRGHRSSWYDKVKDILSPDNDTEKSYGTFIPNSCKLRM